MEPTSGLAGPVDGNRRDTGRAAVARALLQHCAKPAGRLTRLPMSIAGDIDRTHRTVEMVLADLDRSGLIMWVRKRPGGRHRPWWSVKVIDSHGLSSLAAEVRP